jgi:hypothetical protein
VLRVPAEAKAAYRAAEGWRDFFANIADLEECLSGTSGPLKWKVCPDNNTLIISGNGAMEYFSYDYYNNHPAPWCGFTAAVIENGVTSVGVCAFFRYGGLTSITIPNSVAGFGAMSLSYCYGLTEIINYAVTPQPIGPAGQNLFGLGDLTVDRTTCVLKVPEESIEAYRAADGWKDFLNIVAAPPSTGIADETRHATSLQVYPNPVTNGELRVENGEWKIGESIEIYSLSGTLVSRHTTTGEVTAIDVSQLAKGMYLVKVGKGVAKIIIRN